MMSERSKDGAFSPPYFGQMDFFAFFFGFLVGQIEKTCNLLENIGKRNWWKCCGTVFRKSQGIFRGDFQVT